MLGVVVDIENMFMCVHKEEDQETKNVSFKITCGLNLLNVQILILLKHDRNISLLNSKLKSFQLKVEKF